MFEAEKLAGSGSWINKHHRPLVKSYRDLGRQHYGYSFNPNHIIDDLQKALATAALGTGFGDATPLRLENLDRTMTEVLFLAGHLKIFQSIPRVPSIQPLYQWIRHKDYGTQRGSPGFREGGGPKTGVSSWERGNLLNKYLGVRRGYTHQMLITGQMGGSFIDPAASENRDGTLQLLAMIERWLTWGDKDIADESGNEVNYDGIYQQLLDDGGASILDKKGQPLDFEDLENYGQQFVERGKLLSFDNIRTFWKPRVLSDLAKLKTQAERTMMGTTTPPGYRPGVPLDGYKTQHGFFPFEDSIFLDAVEDGKPLATGNAGAPAAPATTLEVVAADATSLMEPGTYYYFSSAINDSGESATTASTGTVVATGEKVTTTIKYVAAATGYRLYRGTTATVADARWIATIKQTTGADATHVDLNQIRPGTGIGILMNMKEDDNALAQMSPLIKYPLPPVDTTIPFLLLLYHVMAVKAPERVVFVKNIGTRE